MISFSFLRRYFSVYQRILIFCILILSGWHELYADTSHNEFNTYLGEYLVTFSGQVGGKHLPTNSIVSGTTTGIQGFTTTGVIILSPSEPGVIGIKPGMQIAGLDPNNNILDAAVIQNPLHVFMGTPNASGVGDFGIYSMMRFGIPLSQRLTYTGCGNKNNPFNCVPVYFKSAPDSGRSVNLIYFTIQTSWENNGLYIKGSLHDTHASEAASANLFWVPVSSPILGNYNDPFMLKIGSIFEIHVSGRQISGRFKGAGESVAGTVSQTSILNFEFKGVRK